MIPALVALFTFAVVVWIGLSWFERPYFPRHGSELFFEPIDLAEARFLFHVIRKRQLRHE